MRKYAAAEEFPARVPHRRQRNIVDPRRPALSCYILVFAVSWGGILALVLWPYYFGAAIRAMLG